MVSEDVRKIIETLTKKQFCVQFLNYNLLVAYSLFLAI